ncbi:2'-5' RNA ligase family protein [Thalassobacillus pellis]|uniref:2'-5' RNA ligase family protein n=1 Tax=Thalassobacillus pellis TaxID=748008 RepID=UPI00308432FE|nr:2'-5' RNA ligase [Thalassobacillus pellis]
MQYFIGIVPPEPYKQRVIEFQQKWKNNRIGDVVEPHITLKAQGGLTSDQQWLPKIEELCHAFKAFTISISQPKLFGEDIVYLSAHSKELYDLHQKLVKSVSPSKALIKQYFEMDDFVPHMTLGKTTYGLTKQELKDMANSAE